MSAADPVAAEPAGQGAGRQAAAMWFASSAGLVLLSPWAHALAERLPACFVKELTGLPCPTCGGTRAALALAGLDVPGALRWNPLVAAGLVLFVAGGVVAGVLALTDRLPREPVRMPLWLRAAVVMAVVGSWVWLVADGR